MFIHLVPNLTLFLPPASSKSKAPQNPIQDRGFRATGKWEENHLKSLLAQGSPEESWEICKVHAGIVVRGLQTREFMFPFQPPTAPLAPIPHLPLKLTARMSPRMGAAPHSTVATTTGSGKAAGCMAAGGKWLRRPRPGSRSRSGVLRPLPPLQDPRGPTTPRSHFPATWGQGEGTRTRGVKYPTRLVELGEEY